MKIAVEGRIFRISLLFSLFVQGGEAARSSSRSLRRIICRHRLFGGAVLLGSSKRFSRPRLMFFHRHRESHFPEPSRKHSRSPGSNRCPRRSEGEAPRETWERSGGRRVAAAV